MATHTYGLLEIDEARYLSNLVGIYYDLTTTVEWCTNYNEILNDIELRQYIEPISSAILVSFMRAFGSGIRNKSARHLLEHLTEEQKVQYEYYRSYRNKHVAHSINEFEENYVKAYYIKEDVEKGISSIQIGCAKLIGLSMEDTKKISNICNSLLSELEVEINNEKTKLLNIVKCYSKEDILKLHMESPKNLNDIDISRCRK